VFHKHGNLKIMKRAANSPHLARRNSESNWSDVTVLVSLRSKLAHQEPHSREGLMGWDLASRSRAVAATLSALPLTVSASAFCQVGFPAGQGRRPLVCFLLF